MITKTNFAVTCFLAATAVASSSASGQSLVFPKHFAAIEGNDSRQRPFTAGRMRGSAGYRYLQLLDNVPAGTYRGLRFRRDGGATGSYKALALTLEIVLSKATTTSASPRIPFDANHGAKFVARSLKVLQLPATSAKTPIRLPAEFEYDIAFDQPYAFAGGTLALEMRVTSRGSSTMRLDGVRSSNTNPGPLSFSLGQGCKTSGSTLRAKLSHTTSHSWARNTCTWTFGGRNLPPNGVAILALGFDNRKWLGVNLPLDVPTSATSRSGLCQVLTSLDVLAAFPTDSNGAFRQNFSLPLDARFHGLDVFSQILTPDARANGLGIVTSNGIYKHWRGPWASAETSVVEEINGVTGLRRSEGLVVQLR